MIFILCFLLGKIDISGKFSVLYEKYPDKPTKPYLFSLHFCTINIVANPSNYLEFTFSHDFVNLGTRHIYGEIFLPRIKSDIKIGKFDIPFGFRLKDHTSLLEDNIGLGLQRPKIGVGFSFRPLIFEISFGLFTPYKGKLDIFSATPALKYNFINIGYGYYREAQDTIIIKTLKEIYAELNPKRYLSFLGKYILGKEFIREFYCYHSALKFHPHHFIAPYIGYEFYDPQKDTKKDEVSRIIYGLECVLPIGLNMIINYYDNKEKGTEIKNNLFAIILTIFF